MLFRSFHCIMQAHLKGVAIDIAYTNSDEPIVTAAPAADGKARRAAPRRRVGPICLFHAKRAWYLLALVLDGRSKGELRQFKLARITHADATRQAFEPPADFSIDEHLQAAWELFRRQGAGTSPQRVVIDFSPAFARNIQETLWHNSQMVETRPDGGVRFTATVNGFDEILWWVLQMGSGAHVVQPSELRKLVTEELDRTRAQYA